MRRLVFAGAHRALFVEVAPEPEREFRLLCLAGREEHRIPRQRRSAREDDALEPAVALEPNEPFLADRDAVAGQPLQPLAVDTGRAVGAQHQIAAPAGQLQRQAESAHSAAVDGQRPVAHFPAVAVGAVEDAHAVQVAEAGNVGQIVGDPRRFLVLAGDGKPPTAP